MDEDRKISANKIRSSSREGRSYYVGTRANDQIGRKYR